MEKEDTVNLLRECGAGVKMGVASIDEVLDRVKSGRLSQTLSRSKEEHEKLGGETQRLLDRYDGSDKEPNAMAKGMAWLKTNTMMAMNGGDDTAAELVTDGCHMGIKSLRRYLNQYKAAAGEAKALAKRLIALEEQLTADIGEYL